MDLFNTLPKFMSQHAQKIVDKLKESNLKFIDAEVSTVLDHSNIESTSPVETTVIIIHVQDDVTPRYTFELGMFIGQCEILAQTNNL